MTDENLKFAEASRMRRRQMRYTASLHSFNHCLGKLILRPDEVIHGPKSDLERAAIHVLISTKMPICDLIRHCLGLSNDQRLTPSDVLYKASAHVDAGLPMPWDTPRK